VEASLSEKTKLGEILVAAGLIDEYQLEVALGEQARWGNRLGETLVRLGYLTETELVRTLSRHFGIPGVQLEGKRIESEILALLPVEVAESYRCIPLYKKRIGGGEILYLGMAHPEDLHVVDDVSFRAGLPVRPVLVGPVQIGNAIAAFYRGENPRPLPGDEASSVLAETPLSDGDTAPVFNDLQQLVSEPAEAAEDGADGEEADTVGREVEEETAPPPVSAEKPRDVPTRAILHALTQILIEEGVISREVLLERIALNRKRSAR
jgi:type IV pilus assembly protein PilB